MAHDGGFGHSRRTLFVSSIPGGWSLEYRIVLNPDEALVEMTRMDHDGDGEVSEDERDCYLESRKRQVAKHLQVLDDNGKPVNIQFEGCILGQALTQTYRFTVATTATVVTLDDSNFPHKPGLVQVRTGPGVTAELAKPADLTHAERVRVCFKKGVENGKQP